jgi:uncharacterized protein YoxC
MHLLQNIRTIIIKKRAYVFGIIGIFAITGAGMLSSHIDYTSTKTDSAPSTTAVSSVDKSSGNDDNKTQEVSRDSYRTLLSDGDNWGGIGSMSVPYSQSKDEKTSRNDLKNAIDNANNTYNGSQGKVKDDTTRQNLQNTITTATDLMNSTTDTTKIDSKKFSDTINAINSAIAGVNDSMSAKTQADAAAAAQAAKSTSKTKNNGNGVSSASGSISAPSGDIQQYALQAMSKYGWDTSQWDSLSFIVSHESGWNPNSLNSSSGARGLFQCLGHAECNTQSYITDYHVQVDWGLNYIANRYGSPNAAAAFWRANSWY